MSRSLYKCVCSVLGTKLKRQVTTLHHLVESWADILGQEEISSVSYPKKLKQGVLEIWVEKGYSTMVQYRSEHIVDSVNDYFGRKLLLGLKIVSMESSISTMSATYIASPIAPLVAGEESSPPFFSVPRVYEKPFRDLCLAVWRKNHV